MLETLNILENAMNMIETTEPSCPNSIAFADINAALCRG